MALGDAFRGAQDKFYDLSEWLEARHVPAITKFVEPLEDRGIPSLPAALVILILVVAAIGGGIALSGGQSTSERFQLRVLSGQEALDGAVVDVYDGDSLVGSATTKNGVATFDSLPKKKLSFRISGAGVNASREIDLTGRTTSTVQLSEITGQQGGPSAQLSVVDSNTSKPIPGARIFYNFLDTSDSADADKNGNAKIPAPVGVEVSVRVTKPGYRPNALTFIASKDKQTIRLDPLGGALLFSPAPPGLVVISATGDSGEPIEGGEARLYDAFTLAKLASSPVEGGTALLENASVGDLAYVVVEAPGYLAFDGSLEPFTVEESNSLEVQLFAATAENSGQTTVNTVDENGAPIPAKVYLLSKDTNSVMAERDSTGELPLEVASDVAYYVVAVAEGRVPARSDPFQAGQSVTVALPLATDSNSANLTVMVTSRDGTAIPYSQVTVATSDGSFAAPQVQTLSDGIANFYNLPLGGSYEVKAVYSDAIYGTMKGSETIVLDSSAELTLVLSAPDGYLDVVAVDSTTGRTVSANFASFRPGDLTGEQGEYSTCTGSTCTLALVSNAEVGVSATASGYADSWLTQVVGPEQHVNATVEMIPSALANGVTVTFDGITDFYGATPVNLLPGKTYTAHFKLTSERGMDWSGIFIRIGDKANAADDISIILEGGFPSADRVAKSTTYSPGANCSDLSNNRAAKGGFKWVDLRWKASGSRRVDIKFTVSDKARTGDSVKFFYRAYGLKGGQWTRSPSDSSMGMGANSSSLAGCYAQTDSYAAQVIAPVAPEAPEVTAEFTQSATVTYDAEKNQMIADVAELKLQVDPIFPFDALPINFSESETVAVISSTAANSTRDCYKMELKGDMHYLVFKPNEANPDCPIGVKGNEIRPDDSASVSFQYFNNIGVFVDVPIKLVATNTPSVFVKPDELSEGDRSAKLIYLINEKQTQRTVLADAEGERKEFTIDPGVKAIAWRGPGTLSITEGGTSVWEGNYPQVRSYFPNMGDLGLIQRKSCTDYLCCTNGWCSKDAAKASFDLFADQAKKIAAATAYRRGDTQPFAYFFPGKKFSMSMVAQLRESTAVTDLNDKITFDELTAGNCQSGNPGVYEIKAQSADGKAWSYSASVLPLYKINYVTDACDHSEYYFRSTPNLGEYVPLCDFLFGDSNCVRSVDHATLLSDSQVTDNHTSPIIVPSWFISLLPNMLICASGDKVFKAQHLTLRGLVASATKACDLAAQACTCGGQAVTAADKQLTTAWGLYENCLNAPAGPGSASSTLMSGCATYITAAVTNINSAIKLSATQACDGACCTPGTCPSQPACMAATALVTEALAQEVVLGNACNNNYVTAGIDPRSWDLPGVILPRAAWMTCYAYADGCHMRCSQRSPYVLIIPVNNQKWYIVHVGLGGSLAIPIPGTGLSQSCSPNLIGMSTALAILDLAGPEFLKKNLGQFASMPMALANVIALADATQDPFFPKGLKSEDAAKATLPIPPKGLEDASSAAAVKDWEDKVGGLVGGLVTQIATTAISGSTPSNAGQNPSNVGR